MQRAGPQATQPVKVQAAKPQDAKQSVAFDPGLFGRWLHMLLVAFYTDEEVVVADLLYRRSALLRDVAIGKTVGLPDRQVRQILERRLVPDSLVERITEGVEPQTQTFYRICPSAIAVAAHRLQTLEDRLGAVVEEEEYSCPKCHRTYDSLHAVSLTGARTNGSDSFAFRCEECGEELIAAAESAKMQHELLQRFRLQCRDLLLLTREIKDMNIPQFLREAPERKSSSLLPGALAGGPGSMAATGPSGAAVAASRAPCTSGTTGNPGAAAGGTPAGSLTAPQASRPAGLDAWFSREVLGSEPLSFAPAATGSRSSDPQGEDEAALQAAVTQAKGHLHEESIAHFSKGLAQRAQNMQRRVLQKDQDPTVTVQSQPYALSRVRDDEDLLDAMTDEEYQRFVDLDRQLHGVRLSRGF